MIIKKRPEFISVIDVSGWEKDAHYDRIHLDFIPDGVIAKASQYKWEDKFAKMHMDGAKLIGAKRGLYHFYQPRDLAAQLMTFFSVAQKAGAWDSGKWLFEIPPILDVEYTPNAKDPKSIRGDALAYEVKFMLDEMEKMTGLKPVIYTGKYYWAWLNSRWGIPPKWSSDYPLWVSAYPNNPDGISKPYLEVGGWGKSWAMWQYSEAGRLPNAFPYDGVDLNIANPVWWDTLPGGINIPNGGSAKIGDLLTDDAARLKDPALTQHVAELHEAAPNLF